jgi:hypothetical protein
MRLDPNLQLEIPTASAIVLLIADATRRSCC